MRETDRPALDSSGAERAASEIVVTAKMREVAELALLRFSRDRSIVEEDAETLVRRVLELAHASSP